ALALGHLEATRPHNRDPGRIISPVFNPVQSLHQYRCRVTLTDVADNPAHSPSFIRRSGDEFGVPCNPVLGTATAPTRPGGVHKSQCSAPPRLAASGGDDRRTPPVGHRETRSLHRPHAWPRTA